MRAAIFFTAIAIFGSMVRADPAAPSYPYKLSAKMSGSQGQKSFSHWQHDILAIAGESLKRVPGGSGMRITEIKVKETDDGYEGVAIKESGFSPKPLYPPDQPERVFWFDISSLCFQTSNERTLTLRFMDAIDTYRLRYADGEGLHVEAIKLEAGSIDPVVVRDFKNLSLAEGDEVWQCNVITTSGARDGKLLWKNDIAMEGQPDAIESLGRVLRIHTTAGCTLMVLKETGEVLLYSPRVLKNDDPWLDIVSSYEAELANADQVKRYQAERLAWRQVGPKPAWVDDPSLRPSKVKLASHYPFIRAAALLEDRRSIPKLIDLVGNGFGLQQRAAAIAALEKINGDATAWNEAKHPGLFLGPVSMDRVYPKQNGIAEQEKWRAIFGLDDTDKSPPTTTTP